MPAIRWAIPLLTALMVVDVHAYDYLTVKYYKVGPGNCVLVNCPGPGKKSLIVDCGSWRVNEKFEVVDDVQSYLDDSTSTDIIITHPDYDHYAFIPEVFKFYHETGEIPIGNVYTGGRYIDYGAPHFALNYEFRVSGRVSGTIYGGGDTYNSTGTILPATSAVTSKRRNRDGSAVVITPAFKAVTSLRNASQSFTCDAAQVDILSVNTAGAYWGTKTNQQSMVVALRYEGRSFIFPGDITNSGSNDRGFQLALDQWAKLILGSGFSLPNYTDYRSELKVDVMMAPHHGADTDQSNWGGWASVTRPDNLVFSADPTESTYRHPRYSAYTPYSNYLGVAEDHTVNFGKSTPGDRASTYSVASAKFAKVDPQNVSNSVFALADTGDITIWVEPKKEGESKGKLTIGCIKQSWCEYDEKSDEDN